MKRNFAAAIALSILLTGAISFAGNAQRQTCNRRQIIPEIPAARTTTTSGIVGADDKPDLHTCNLTPVDKVWRGSCGPIFNVDPVLTLTRAEGITTGIWRKGIDPTAVWSGALKAAAAPIKIEIELYDKGTGILRFIGGWFSVSDFSVSPKSLQFKIDTSHVVPPSDLDREIIQRAASILSSESSWNREDSGECDPTATKWSIYCAIQQAATELTGVFHNRRPAVDLIRAVVTERTAGRDYGNRLVGYNNDPTTKFADVQSLFTETLSRMNNSSKGMN